MVLTTEKQINQCQQEWLWNVAELAHVDTSCCSVDTVCKSSTSSREWRNLEAGHAGQRGEMQSSHGQEVTAALNDQLLQMQLHRAQQLQQRIPARSAANADEAQP